MFISNDVKYIGVNDHNIDLFEGQYVVPNGMSYNSYLIKDQKTLVVDSVDANFTQQWITNIKAELGSKGPDYILIQHMEPDHSGSIKKFMDAFKDTTIVSSKKAFTMMNNFFKTEFEDRRVVVDEGDTLELGSHVLNFVTAPMVHWPEVIMTYDSTDKILFSADGFGKFGALDVEEDWACEARRYYIGIVGKYGAQVQNVLKKAKGLDIQIICPLHGPVLSENLAYYINLYDIWSSYGVETEGIAIFYTSVYGHTKEAVELLAKKFEEKGCPKIAVNDLAREDMAECVEDAFRYGKIVLATTTYNSEIFPFMKEFINHLVERNFQNKTIAMIENGSWAPMAVRTMKKMLEGCKNISYVEPTVRIMSALSDENIEQLDKVADELCVEYLSQHEETANKSDLTALFKIGYGLYVVTTNDGVKDNGLIVNTVTQVSDNPNRVAVNVNKLNYSHDIIKKTGILNVNCLSQKAPFSVFECFGFRSGRDVDKFEGQEVLRSTNGLVFLSKNINAFFSLKVEDYVDLGSHGMFICTVTEARVINHDETMTYTYYQANVKPKPDTGKKKGWVCKICGYVYEGEDLPEDFICPLCKHGAADFEKIE